MKITVNQIPKFTPAEIVIKIESEEELQVLKTMRFTATPHNKTVASDVHYKVHQALLNL